MNDKVKRIKYLGSIWCEDSYRVELETCIEAVAVERDAKQREIDRLYKVLADHLPVEAQAVTKAS
jgi:hypothetical protein